MESKRFLIPPEAGYAKYTLSFSPSGHKLLTYDACEYWNEFEFFDLRTRTKIGTMQAQDERRSFENACFSTNENLVVAAE